MRALVAAYGRSSLATLLQVLWLCVAAVIILVLFVISLVSAVIGFLVSTVILLGFVVLWLAGGGVE